MDNIINLFIQYKQLITYRYNLNSIIVEVDSRFQYEHLLQVYPIFQ
jgi:hypothetical protein